MAPAAHDRRSTPCPTCSGAGHVRATQGHFSIERTCPKCQGSGAINNNPSPTRGSSQTFEEIFSDAFHRSGQPQSKSQDIPKAVKYVVAVGALLVGATIFALLGTETGDITQGRTSVGRQMTSQEGKPESTAETWAKVSGALLGMANACDLQMSTGWIENATHRMKTLAGSKDDFSRAGALFLDFRQKAYDNQKQNRPMTCQEIAQFAADSERKWGK